MLDAGFVGYNLYRLLNKQYPTADDYCDYAAACVAEDEELFRIYYYDCPPYDRKETNPVSGRQIDFGATPTARRNQSLCDAIALKPHVAFRRGVLSFDGWSLSKTATRDLIQRPRPVTEDDLVPTLRQKRVDMKIGLDVAWLASKRIVDRIILVTGDSDFVPAMKFARREGVQVILVTMGQRQIKRDLREHADILRDVVFPVADS